MAFFGKLRLANRRGAATLCLLFSVLFGIASLSHAQGEMNDVPMQHPDARVSVAGVHSVPPPVEESVPHHVHIEFCASWGMRRNFAQVKQYLETHFPELRGGKITGGNYAPPAFIELLMKLLSFVQLAGIVMVLLGTNTFTLLGMSHVPRWYDGVQKNGVQIAILVFLVLPKVLSSYVITGAFEVTLDNKIVVFSKLSTGRLPTWQDLVIPLVEAGLTRAEVS